jgi:hypothetical protein
MKKGFVLIVLLLNATFVFAQNEIGPEGHKLLWVLLGFIFITAVFVFITKPFGKKTKKQQKPIFTRKKLKIDLEKDAVYYPDNLSLKVTNTGNTDLDIDQPLLVFDNFWLKRKFKLKGMGNRTFYPLYLEKGKTHTLQIDLNRFYGHDKSLKKFPKAKVYLTEVKGKKLGSQSVFLRKTLLKY